MFIYVVAVNFNYFSLAQVSISAAFKLYGCQTPAG